MISIFEIKHILINMKAKFFSFLLLSLFFSINVTAQTNTGKIDPIGNWKFDAPYAPEGYTTGTIVLGMTENVYTANMSFTGSDYKIPGEKVKVENNTLSFLVYVEYEAINITLKIESETKMSGKAVYSEGEIPLALTKVEEKK